jgi:bla regulator protein blaR1
MHWKLTVIALAAAGLCAAQPPDQPAAASAAPMKFEVASIKPSAPGQRFIRVEIQPGGRLTCQNVPAKWLIEQAYGIKDFQLSGAPGWIGSDHYDINAEADTSAAYLPKEQIQAMVRSLLADRFALKTHTETKEMSVYALVVGKNGPKFHESAKVAPEPGPDGGGPGGPGAGGPPDGPPNGPKRLGRRGGAMMRMGRGEISAQQISMTVFATQLSQMLGRSVIDKTGLTGKYDLKLHWTPEEGEFAGPKEPGPDAPPPADPNGPSIYTALQEQLGLKLEGRKGPVEIVVIDHIEKPSAN